MGPTAISERVELAKLCSSRDWSKAIRILDSLLSQSTSIQDICNRAFCYSQLELHKHVIKDCDRALQLDPALLQAYILKGRALSSLGRNEDAVLVWEQGCEHALRQSADLKQLLELEELLNLAKQDRSNVHETHVNEARSFTVTAESGHLANGKSSDNSESQNKLSDVSESCNGSTNASEIYSESGDNLEMHNGICDNAGRNSPMSVLESGPYANGKSSDAYIDCNESGDMPTVCSELGDASEICRNSVDKFNTANSLNDEGGENEEPDGQRNETPDIIPELSQLKEPDGQLNGTPDTLPKLSQLKEPDGLMNGTLDILPKLSHGSVSCNSLSSTSEPSRKLSIVCGSSGDGSGIVIKSNNGTDMRTETSNESRRNKKFCVTRISKTKSISIDFRLSRGIAQVNEGKYASAISIFDQILREDPTYPEALIGRGTAYAFQRELESAIGDFSKAIESNPSAVEAWKRRGQARAALGESAEAIEDLTKALEFEPNSADILHERGIVNFKFKDFTAAIEDLSACVKLDKDNKSAFTYLGLAFSPIGEYKRAEEAHLKSIQLDRSFLEAWAHMTQFYQDLANSTKAFECIEQVLQIDIRFAKAYHLRGSLLHGLGEHRKAIKDLSVGLSIESSNIECLYLRASCYHAVGEYADAVKDYDAALDLELDSIEKFVLQCLAFYQKEIALYTASKINSEFCWFDIDGDIDPLFKEYWCKRLHPKHVCEKVFRQPPLRESLKRGKLRKQEFTMTKQKTALLLAADSIGQKIQYDCPGFLPNRRQHRMAGLAAIEIAQKVSKAWRSLQAEWKHANKGPSKYGKRGRRRINMLSQNRGGAGCSTSSSSETSSSYGTTEDRSGRSLMSWQDIYSLAVKWRQISEPCDPIVWINKLSEEFNTGFGSHTPMILGQAKVFRYYPNFERTFDLAKTIMKEKLYVRNKADEIIHIPEEKLQDIMDANTCSDLYKVVCEDFWLATWCNSTAFEEKQLEGTRITVAKMGENGYDFAIRTPCTSSRWDDFDAEMATAWEAVCNAYCGENYGSNDLNVLENVRNAIIRMTFYWYNFMPLSRGSAVVGFTVLLGLLLAANMEFTGKIPKGLQVDWEAILNFEPDSFVDSVRSWLYPSLKVKTSWKDFPDVANTFSTTGSVVAALSSYDN